MLNLDNAVVYDIECFPNCFTINIQMLNSDTSMTFEISEFRDDRQSLMQWLQYFAQSQTPMIGFNIIHYDYPMLHFFFHNPQCTYQQLYEKNCSIIDNKDRFGGPVIWPSDRVIPQIDLFKIYHMDNHAKSTTLKALQINMRSDDVMESTVPFGVAVTREQVDTDVIPYNSHDTGETKRFAKFSMDAINFRLSLIEKFGVDVLNWPDTKIGSKIMESRLGPELCYTPAHKDANGVYHKKQMRQTPRTSVALADVIFPYIQFQNPEFNAVLNYLRSRTLGQSELKEFNESPSLETKGVFNNLKAHVGGIDFCFGTGGIHGSVSGQRIVAGNGYEIIDVDVAGYYPDLAIKNGLSPEHLGQPFVDNYRTLPEERKRVQKEKGKKCTEANSYKLAGNSVYGNSNSPWSVFYDPKYTMTITINGQLLLCMLAEWLLTVPSLKLIQVNTDGITYFVHSDHKAHATHVCREWEKLTKLTLEDNNYNRMWIRDVNSYIAEDMKGELKLKGAYWTPDPMNYHKSISEAQPPAWHKDLGNCVSARAAVAAMVHGVDPESFIRICTNPFDFMCRIKVNKTDNLLLNGEPVQRTSRYFVSLDGGNLVKHSPPTGVEGTYKKKTGVSDLEYNNVMIITNGEWDERVCTKNRSKHGPRQQAIEAGYLVTLCNKASDFSFDKVNYRWYANEARKLII